MSDSDKSIQLYSGDLTENLKHIKIDAAVTKQVLLQYITVKFTVIFSLTVAKTHEAITFTWPKADVNSCVPGLKSELEF